MHRFSASRGFFTILPLFSYCLSASLPLFQYAISNPAPPVNSTSNSFTTLVIDTFNDTNINALGFFHGVSGDVSMTEFDDIHPVNELQVSTDNIDGEGCVDFRPYKDQYIHISYNGPSRFTVSLQQHNKACDETKVPFPETYDSVQATRYTTSDDKHIYIPVSHFRIDMSRVTGLALENWYTRDQTTIYRVEMVEAAAVPPSVRLVTKLDTGTIWNACINPDHVAIGIDDGAPEFLQCTLQIIKDEKIPVTFFVQGSALLLPEGEANFTAAYIEMIGQGHQIGLHTETHPHMEAVKTQQEIDYQISENVKVVKSKLGVDTKYFRPPYGTIGARTRQALGKLLPNPQIVMWSIDVRDWVYGIDASGDPDRMQYKAFADQLNRGGTIVVMHYLYKSTVDQFQDMIKIAKSQGRKFVRMDECIGQASSSHP